MAEEKKKEEIMEEEELDLEDLDQVSGGALRDKEKIGTTPINGSTIQNI